jgi:hypothetical protein
MTRARQHPGGLEEQRKLAPCGGAVAAQDGGRQQTDDLEWTVHLRRTLLVTVTVDSPPVHESLTRMLRAGGQVNLRLTESTH